ncbi:MAG: DNA-processing protein DprA [Gammaproteobacteria bacterium]|nr:DNA-processing protein DprA [Gammaproteobacteria bacterium]
MDELQHWLKISLNTGLSSEKLLFALEKHLSIARLTETTETELKSLNFTPQQIALLKSPADDKIDAMLKWADEASHHVIPITDQRYPEQLKIISNPPKVLFVNGDLDYLYQTQLAMVGSRSPTAIGKKIAEDFARHLSDSGLTITSGLARGIDAASHRGALMGMAGTVAVVATGLDRVYPAENRALAHQICEQGVLVSEQPLGVAPHAGLFPLRNRIISGLSQGVLVVEAAIRSGTLITARHAIEQNREVFAIPGSIHNPAVKGCHALIKQGAKLVENADDILEDLQILVKNNTSGDTIHENIENEPQEPDSEYQKLLSCMGYDPIDIDSISECTGFSAANIASMLLILELQGEIVVKNGFYTRCGKRENK